MSLAAGFMLKEFRTEENAYLYCARTNQIFCTDPVIVAMIPLYKQLPLSDIQQRLGTVFDSQSISTGHQIIDSLVRQHGFFQSDGLCCRVSPVSQERICADLDRDVQQMCLEITEGCNLRCHYCAYSGGYAYNRQHGTRSMPQAIARTAIDLFFKKNQDRKEPFALSFYGGEPLMQIPLIKFCVQYARSLPWQNPEALSFNMTTNATLLDDETIRFLVDNKFSVLVSLNGPMEDHDAHRVYAGGGGTFARVMANLHRFNEIAPEYPFLSVSCVITPTADVLRTNDFFVEHRELFRQISINKVTPDHKTFFHEYPSDPGRQGQQFRTLYQQYVAAHLQPGPPVSERSDMVFIRPLFERDFMLLHKRDIVAQMPTDFEITTTCFPGKRKVLVDVQGRLHVCERIANTYSIGDVWSGYHLPTIKQILDEYTTLMNRQECLSCWAVRFCPACFANMAGNGHLSLERTQALCQNARETLVRTLQTYCSILEQSPDAFKYMDKYWLT